jgi:L-aspartate oxidase
LRGEGALLINARGERFMRAAHDDAELAPRDVVARAVYRELTIGRGAFLDCRSLGTKLEEQFPTVFASCIAAGIDPTREPIPVAPAAHYHMGGILTDARGRCTVDGLWACGEVASTGAHGANRLASNSLLEAVVFGARVAKDIASTVSIADPKRGALHETAGAAKASADGDAAERRLRAAMTEGAGVIRDAQSLRHALGEIAALEGGNESDYRLANMLATAKLIAAAALKRKESRGAHFRSDYPIPDESLARRSFLTLAEAETIAREATEREPARARAAGFAHAAARA